MFLNPSLTFYFKMFLSTKAGLGAISVSLFTNNSPYTAHTGPGCSWCPRARTAACWRCCRPSVCRVCRPPGEPAPGRPCWVAPRGRPVPDVPAAGDTRSTGIGYNNLLLFTLQRRLIGRMFAQWAGGRGSPNASYQRRYTNSTICFIAKRSVLKDRSGFFLLAYLVQTKIRWISSGMSGRER